MIKNVFRASLTGLALIMSFQAAAFADSVEGRVAKATPQELDMTVYDAEGRPYPNALILEIDPGTQLNGMRSMEDLYPNDAIGANIHQEEDGRWAADSITLFQQVDVQPATKKPSSSLSNALGNPVVKGALLGAATGAIASSASHGKAGKGALIGAGVGALLGGIFNQPDNSSDN